MARAAAAVIDVEVLLALVRGDRPPASTDAQCPRVAALAEREGVAPLLHARLQAAPALAAVVPDAARAHLREAYQRTWARNSVLVSRWHDVVRTLDAAGIPALALKGVALVQGAYADPGLRPMADVDVLVPAPRFDAARTALVEAGWTSADGDGAAANDDRGYALLTCGGAVLDLHRDVAGYPRVAGVVRVDHDGLWRRAQPLPGGGWQLSTEDQVLHLALHVVLGSEFGRLLNYVDIDRVLRHAAGKVRWDAMLAEATRWRVSGVLGYALRAAAGALGAPVPVGVLARLAPRGLQRLLARVVDPVRPPSLAGRPSAARLFIAETLLMDRPRFVLRVARTTVFPPARWLRFHYKAGSRWRLCAFRALHPLRVCVLAARAMREERPRVAVRARRGGASVAEFQPRDTRGERGRRAPWTAT